MPTRSTLPMLLAAALMAMAAGGAWAQDGRGHGRGGQGHDRGGGQDRAMEMRDDGFRMRQPPSMIVEPMQSESRRSRRDDGLSESIRRIQRSTRGQVISAERMQSDGRDVNRIKVMDDRGRVRVYMDDPQQRRGPPTRDDDN